MANNNTASTKTFIQKINGKKKIKDKNNIQSLQKRTQKYNVPEMKKKNKTSYIRGITCLKNTNEHAE